MVSFKVRVLRVARMLVGEKFRIEFWEVTGNRYDTHPTKQG